MKHDRAHRSGLEHRPPIQSRWQPQPVGGLLYDARTPQAQGSRGTLRRLGQAQATVAAVQGCCYAAMGLWPLVHMHSFEVFTGPKYNTALMQVAGSMLAVIGFILLLGSLQRAISSTTVWLGGGIAGVMGLLACTFVSTGRMPPIYLWDGALEAIFVGWWVLAGVAARRTAQAGAQAPSAPETDRGIAYTTYLGRAERDTLH